MPARLSLFFIFLFVVFPVFSQDEGDDIFSEDDIFSSDNVFAGEDTEDEDNTGDGSSGTVSEDDIFSDKDAVTKEDIFDDTVGDELGEESVTFSGRIETQFGYNFTRDFLKGDADFDDNSYSAYVGADLMLDVRFRKGIKAFADLYVGYLPTKQYTGRVFISPYAGTFIEEIDTVVSLKEFFIDANINHHVYFRAGKQVAKWGRGYLWNPTDFINVERRSFLNMDVLREGVYGLRMHIPIKTIVNIYSFVNVTDTDDLLDFGFSNKLEFLIRNVETSVSCWAKRNKYPIFGFDISFNLFDIEFRGEASFSYGYNTPLMHPDGTEYKLKDQFVTSVSFGFTKSFDIGDVSDRLTIIPEFYYNLAGYDDDMFENPVTSELFRSGGYYEYTNYGKIYSALFFNFKKFIISNMDLNINTLGNFTDLSFVLSTGITYSPVYNVTLDFDVLSYLGKENREFTYSGNTLALMFTLSLKF